MNIKTPCGTTACVPGASGAGWPTETAEPIAKGVSYFKPSVDVIEHKNAYMVRADLPGAAAESIAIDYENGALTLTARVEPRLPKGVKPIVREYGVGDYRRVFRVGESIDTARIEAEFKNGVLHITLPKAEAIKPRKVQVKATAS